MIAFFKYFRAWWPLPFSNRKKEGFENQIANLLSEWLDKPLTYTWFPSAIGFVHNTLTKKKCDVIIGIPTGSGKVLNTNPYYRYAYSIIYRKDSGIQVDRIDHPEMANLRIGTIAGTPPNIDLHAFNLMSRVRPYNLTYNTLVENPNERMIEDLESGLIDIALLSGHIGAYYGKKHVFHPVMKRCLHGNCTRRGHKIRPRANSFPLWRKNMFFVNFRESSPA